MSSVVRTFFPTGGLISKDQWTSLWKSDVMSQFSQLNIVYSSQYRYIKIEEPYSLVSGCGDETLGDLQSVIKGGGKVHKFL